MMAPLRSAAYAVWFYTITAAFCLAGLWVRLFARHLALGLARRWARSVLAGLEPLCGIRVEVTGRRHLPANGPALLASQHQSAFDTIVWMSLLDRPSYVMKQELRRLPLFGPLLEPAGMIPVDRSAGATALRALLRAAGRAAADGRQIVIFPEGTRTPPGRRVPLQPGVVAIAGRTGLPVLPVATDSGICWPRGILAKRPGVIRIVIGPPIAPLCLRETMLAQVEEFWMRNQVSYDEPVDNSVDARPPAMLGQPTVKA